jgi:predicted enzyme related to lactoylglutathione lyase
MRFMTAALASFLLAAASAFAQDAGAHVYAIRVLATDAEAVAAFYEKAFGMSETRRPVNSAAFKEIVVNFGSTADVARNAAGTPIVIATRGKDAPAGAMAALIIQVPNLEKAIESVKANGGTLLRPPNKTADGLAFAFVKDPDGNQIELVTPGK